MHFVLNYEKKYSRSRKYRGHRYQMLIFEGQNTHYNALEYIFSIAVQYNLGMAKLIPYQPRKLAFIPTVRI